MPKYPMIRIDHEDDPERCQGMGQHGQCNFKRVEGSEYCPMHGGNNAGIKREKQELRNYKINQARMRADLVAKANSSGLIDLRDEVALTRYLLEKILNTVDHENDLILQSSAISELVGKIEKLVVSCHKLELSTNSVLDEKQLVALAGTIVGIITTTIDSVTALADDQRSALKGDLASAIVNAVQATLKGDTGE
jgi:hypothetical protein